MQRANITYFLSRSLFLGFGISILLSYSHKDSYLAAFVGLFLGLFLTFTYSAFINKKGNISLLDLLKNKGFLGVVTRIVFIIISLIILLYTLVLYKEFIGSFLLVNSPEFYFLIPIVFLSLYLALKGLKIISRVASSLIIFSLFLSLVTFIGLVSFFEVSNFLPLLTCDFSSFLKTVVVFASIAFFPNLLIIHFPKTDKAISKMYIISGLGIIFTLICIIGVFGEKLVNIFRFPEYMILKQLKLFKFIEKIENIISISWIFDLFITSTMAFYSLRELIYPPQDKKITTIIAIIMLLITEFFFANNYTNVLRAYHLLPALSIISIISAFLLLTLIFKKIKR